MTTLADLARAGYQTDEWARWQQGGCLEYALALIEARPALRLGTLDNGAHFFAHDDARAYDSAGSHPLPYLGIGAWADQCELDARAGDYDPPDTELMPAARAHIARHPGSETTDTVSVMSACRDTVSVTTPRETRQ